MTGPSRLHLIGTAATPLGGDHLDISVEVGRGAHLEIQSVAATLALPHRDTLSSSARWSFQVANDGSLDVDAQPLVVAGGAHHHATTVVRLCPGARIRLRERVQIGRAGETGGRWRGDLSAEVALRPLLRHTIELGPGTALDDVLDAPRAMVSDFCYPDERPAATNGLRGARLPLAGGGSLDTWLGARLSTA